MICVFNAVVLSWVAIGIWIACLFLDKDIKDLGLVIGLCGTFLGTLIAKAGQSFAERGKDE